MPYSRRYRRKRYRRRRYSKRYCKPHNKYSKYLSMAARALSIAYGVKRMLNVEYKFHDVAFDGNVRNVFQVTQLNNLVQGDTTNTRDGSQVKFVSIDIKGYVEKITSVTSDQVRLILLYDRQPNGALFSSSNFIKDNTDVNSHLNLDYARRFIVMAQRMITLTDDKPRVRFHIHKKINMKVRYQSNTGTIADLTERALFFCRLGTQTAVNESILKYNIRLRYVDN